MKMNYLHKGLKITNFLFLICMFFWNLMYLTVTTAGLLKSVRSADCV